MGIFSEEEEGGSAYTRFATIEHNTVTVMLKSVSLVIIICAGAVENATVIYTVVKDRKLHRAPYYYVINLSFADLMRGLLCLPFVLATTMHGSVWRYGRSGCKLLAFTSMFFTFGALFALFILSLDRYISIVHYKFHHRRFKGLMCLVMVLGGWAVAFLLAFPPVFGLGTYKFIPAEDQCSLEHRYYTNNDTLGFTMIFVAFLALTLFVYSRIFVFLRRRRKMRPILFEPARNDAWALYGHAAGGLHHQNYNIPGNNNNHNVPAANNNNHNVPAVQGLARAHTNPVAVGVPHNQPFITARYMQTTISPKNEKLTRLFLATTVLFDFLWLPYLVMCLWFVFSARGDVWLAFATVATWLTYLQVAALPLVYFLGHPPFRKSFGRSMSMNLMDGYVLRETQRSR